MKILMSPAQADATRAEFKYFLRQIITNPKEEAYRQGVSLSTVYAWLDPNKQLDFPVWRAGFSTGIMGIIGYLNQYTHPASFTLQMSDAWATLSELFGQIYRKHKAGEYDPKLVGAFQNLFDAILSEYNQHAPAWQK